MTWNVRIGINPIGWMNDDLPSLGGDTPLDTALSEGRAIGYAGFELGNKFPSDPAELKARLDGFGLACVSGWYSGFLAEALDGPDGDAMLAREVQRCIAHMRKLRHNGCDAVVYGECAGTVQGLMDTPVSRRPLLRGDAAWQEYARRLDAFGRHLLDEYGLRLAYHHHMGACVESPSDVDRLMELTDPRKVFLLFDTGHAYFGGATQPVDLLRRHVGRVAHVHCKDVRPQVIAKARNESWSFLRGVLAGVFTVPGDGALDFGGVLRTLHEANYAGWLVVEAEQDPAVAPSEPFARKGFETLRALVDGLGAGA
ncbi:myo-inosose-2 dehydratase [Thiomonas sp.]|uniref:myo-inosose-2 dehydratase n=1 Tax=Thiomonas sp. TaxID=2047785 RepID=UPI0026362373|nr:myo-inosose-2 dehydratase [Thiomonas sp.]